MEIKTANQMTVTSNLLENYFEAMVNRFFKILPMWEQSEPSLPVYLDSLQMELIGCQEFIPEVKTNHQFLSLLAILQYMIDAPDTNVATIKREVFRAISICNKIKARYGD